MTSPLFSQPIIRSKAQLTSDASLSSAFRDLANKAYTRPRANDPTKWNDTGPRFPTINTVYEMLTDDSVVALIFDLSSDGQIGSTVNEDNRESKKGHMEVKSEKLVACATARPWKGGWMREGEGTESGWEINALSVDGGEKYLRRGLSVQLLHTLEKHIIQLSRAQLGWKEIHDGHGEISLWVLAADCLNGSYWRKRGYNEIRRKTEGAGVWNCRTSFEMVVFRKGVGFEI